MSLSVFPNGGIDTWTYLQDLSASDLLNAETYRNLRIKSSTIALSSAEQTQVNSIATNLRYKGINVVDLNKLFDAISSTQLFTQTTLTNYFKYCGDYNPLTNYFHYNSVSYNGNTFMSLNNQIGVTPIDDGVNWKQNSSKGDTGNTGATGANGLGLTYVGNYSNTAIYYIGNAFNSNNSIYYCTNTSPAGTSPTNTSYFQLFLSNSGVVIQATEPVSKYVNLVWIDSSTSQNIIKYWTGSAWIIVGGNVKALDISIADVGNKITATNVEDFATEMVDKIATLNGSGAVVEKVSKSVYDAFLISNATSLADNAKDYVRSPAFGPATGAVNAYTFSAMVATALVDGMSVYLDNVIAANTGASTFNWSGLGAKAIVDSKGVALTAGKMPLNCIVGLRYNASASNFQLLGEGGDALTGNLVAGDLLVGKTGYSNDPLTKIIGSMPNNLGAKTGTIYAVNGHIDVVPPIGFFPGTTGGYVHIDEPNFLNTNIPIGATMFGLPGTAPRKAEGTATVSAQRIVVTGLPFTPSLITLSMVYNSQGARSAYFPSTANKIILADGTAIPVTYSGISNGFTVDLPVGTSTNIPWKAYE